MTNTLHGLFRTFHTRYLQSLYYIITYMDILNYLGTSVIFRYFYVLDIHICGYFPKMLILFANIQVYVPTPYPSSLTTCRNM